MASVFLLFSLLGVCHASISSHTPSSTSHTPSTKLYDLSHAYSSSMPYQEGTSPFEPEQAQIDEERFSALEFCMSEKLGTHINFPSYYGVSQAQHYPLHLLVNIPCVVMDVGGTSKGQRGVALTQAGVELWEGQNGKVPPGSVVILRSGWSTFFSQAESFYGLFSGEDSLVMPGLDASAAGWLVSERGVVGVATECPSIEVGGTGVGAGQALADGGAYNLVQVAGVDQMPPTGAKLTVAPLKLEGGSGGPARLLAVVEVKKDNVAGQDIDNNISKVKRVEPTTASSEVRGQEVGVSPQVAGLEVTNASTGAYSQLCIVIMCLGVGVWNVR